MDHNKNVVNPITEVLGSKCAMVKKQWQLSPNDPMGIRAIGPGFDEDQTTTNGKWIMGLPTHPTHRGSFLRSTWNIPRNGSYVELSSIANRCNCGVSENGGHCPKTYPKWVSWKGTPMISSFIPLKKNALGLPVKLHVSQKSDTPKTHQNHVQLWLKQEMAREKAAGESFSDFLGLLWSTVFTIPARFNNPFPWRLNWLDLVFLVFFLTMLHDMLRRFRTYPAVWNIKGIRQTCNPPKLSLQLSDCHWQTVNTSAIICPSWFKQFLSTSQQHPFSTHTIVRML